MRRIFIKASITLCLLFTASVSFATDMEYCFTINTGVIFDGGWWPTCSCNATTYVSDFPQCGAPIGHYMSHDDCASTSGWHVTAATCNAFCMTGQGALDCGLHGCQECG